MRCANPDLQSRSQPLDSIAGGACIAQIGIAKTGSSLEKKICANLVRSVALTIERARIERIGINRFAKRPPLSPGKALYKVPDRSSLRRFILRVG